MSRSPADWRPDWIEVGRVGRPHGLDGSVHLDGYGGVVPLERGTQVRIGAEDATVVARKGTEERPILRLTLASDRDGAAGLRGRVVAVASATLPPVDADEFFHVDLVGCTVYAGERALGEVRAVLSYPANDVLEVGEEPLFLPFVADAVLEVDLPGRRIVVRDDLL